MNTPVRTALKWSAGALGLATGAYAGYVAVTWLGYGHPSAARVEDADLLLDQVMPTYEVAERRHIHVDAPADVTFDAACEADLMRLPVVRALFRTREIVLGSEPDAAGRPHGLLAFTRSLGWNVLAEVPGQEIVMGSVTQPWKADVVFRRMTPDEFKAFNEPDYVKIAWTLRADATDPQHSTFRHETRVQTTDAGARAKFRRYWAFFSPGIKLIRWLLLEPVRREAERRARIARTVT